MQLPDLLFLVYDYLKFEHVRPEKHLASTVTQGSLSVARNTTISETISHITNHTKDKFATDVNLDESNKSQSTLSIEERVTPEKYELPDSIKELQRMHTEMNERIEELNKKFDEIKQQFLHIPTTRKDAVG